MSEVDKLTAEDKHIILSADEIYYLDWRENDDDENTSGWRHPGYYLEVGQSYDFEKLVSAGLMEKRATTPTPYYRISNRGAILAKEILSARQQSPALAASDATGEDGSAVMRMAVQRSVELVEEKKALLDKIAEQQQALARAEAALEEILPTNAPIDDLGQGEPRQYAIRRIHEIARQALSADGKGGESRHNVTVSPEAKQRLMDEHGLDEGDFTQS